ncbi:MAG TPA: hypothetical protein VNJ01_14300 [Bacteriovoracaceae bacterium]|nr:hypothetical protein [Bacteriovoracaceae bacterium]
MKRLLSCLLLLCLSFTALAADGEYFCQLKKSNSRVLKELAALKLPGYYQGDFDVDRSVCTGKRTSSHSDFCKVKGNFLVVGLKPENSLFISKRGKTYEYSCEEYQGQQQQQEEESEPGHGGHTCARCKSINNN